MTFNSLHIHTKINSRWIKDLNVNQHIRKIPSKYHITEEFHRQDTENAIIIDKSDYIKIQVVCLTENTINKIISYVMEGGIGIGCKLLKISIQNVF